MESMKAENGERLVSRRQSGRKRRATAHPEPVFHSGGEERGGAPPVARGVPGAAARATTPIRAYPETVHKPRLSGEPGAWDRIRDALISAAHGRSHRRRNAPRTDRFRDGAGHRHGEHDRSTAMTKLVSFLKNESGATAIEYGLLASLIAVAIITAVGAAGSGVGNTFTKVGNKLQ
jgi:pilus assembly protein Flp/PilA